MIDRPSSQRRTIEWVVFAVSVVCYLNVLPNDYCFDDILIVRDNIKVNDSGQWKNIWTTDHWAQSADSNENRDLLYRPVSLSSYRVVRVWFGTNPWPQHLVNILLHAMVAVMVVGWCRWLGGNSGACWLAGLWFAVLPIHVEVIASVVGRADLLATLCTLLALQFHRRICLSDNRTAALIWRIAAGALIFFALGCKESGLAVLPLLVVLDGFIFRQDIKRTHQLSWWTLHTLSRLFYIIIPFAAYMLLRYYALGERFYQHTPMTKTINVLVDAPVWQHGLGVVQLWGMYWAKTVWPYMLSVKYSINDLQLTRSLLHMHVLIGIAALLMLCVLSCRSWKKGNRNVAFLSVSLVLCYLPTANIYPLIQVFFAERIWYLPSVWLVILVAIFLTPLMKQRIVVLAGVVLVASMMGRCWLRNSEWKNNGTLYAAAWRDAPDSVGPLQLYGQWLTEHDQVEPGIDLLHRAIDIDMGFTDAHRSLGRAYLKLNNFAQAVKYLQIADMQVSGHSPTTEALLYARRQLVKDHEEEFQQLQKSVDENPDDMPRVLLLIRKMREWGWVADALKILQQFDARFQRQADWHLEYAVTLVFLNRAGDAIDRYEKSLTLDSQNAQVMVELAMLLLERREGDDLDRAWDLSGEAFVIAPNLPTTLVCRAELLALRGDLSGALEHYRKAIELLPVEHPLRRAYEQRAKTLGN